MKKGKSFSQFRIKLYVCLRSGFFYALLVFLATFISAVVSVVLNVSAFSTVKEHTAIEYANLFLSLATTIITAYGTIRSGFALYRAYFSRQLIHPDTLKDDIIKIVTTKNSKLYDGSNYKWGVYNNQRYLYSEAVDDILRDRGHDMRLKVIPRKAVMNENQKWLLYQIVSEKIDQGKIIFNAPLVRLRTDMLLNSKQKVVVQKTDYFSNITSNDMIYSQAFESDFSKIYKGRDMTVDTNGLLYNLSDSPAANIIGVTTLAITSDGYVIINVQSNNNDVNNDSMVPSGSGSADFDDLKKADFGRKTKEIKAAKKELRSSYKDLKKARKMALCCKSVPKYANGAQKCKSQSSDDASWREEYNEYYKARNEYNKNLSEYRYLVSMRRYECSLNQFLIEGMQRELKEESYLTDSDLKCTYVCGYIRILDRGGKPDFFGITFLNCNKKEALNKFRAGKDKYVRKEISKKQQIADFNEVDEPKYIKVDQIYNCESISNISGIENYNVSLQLHYMELLVKRNKKLIDENLNSDNS